MNTQKQIFLIVILFFVMTASCAAYAFIEPVRSERQSDFFDKESIRRGALLYANNCRTCHGNTGEGGVGLPLNKDEFKNQDPLVLQANRDLIHHTLECGRAGTFMPVWLKENGGALTEIQLQHLINLITAPATETDEEGNPSNVGWEEALEFAHNLNSEIAVAVGGDTLDTIAVAHHLGYAELAEANGVDVNHVFAGGDTVTLPSGGEVDIFEDRLLTRVADEHHVGAIILAELNGFGWEVDGTNLHLLVDGEQVTGLLPGEELELPDDAVYVVTAGDTLEAIAERHGLSASAIRSANPENDNVQDAATDEELEFERRLVLPGNASVVVQAGQTAAIVATVHGVTLEDLLAENDIEVADAATVLAGTELQLPDDGFRYIIQPGDTLASIASVHGVGEDALAEENDLEPGAFISPQLILNLPKVEGYVIQGQSLEEIADDYGNTSAASLAEASDVGVDDTLRVGTALHLPPDSWGTAPSLTPGAETSGEICIKNAVSAGAYDGIFGEGDSGPPTAPEEVSTSVEIVAHANDWTVVADGEESEPNEGAVTVAPGSQIVFRSDTGMHSITVDGEQAAPDINTGDEETVTFAEPSEDGFQITCIYHPDMEAWVFLAPAS